VFTEKVGFLAAAIAIGICLYVAFQWIFNREEVEEFKSLFSRKKSEHIKG